MEPTFSNGTAAQGALTTDDFKDWESQFGRQLPSVTTSCIPEPSAQLPTLILLSLAYRRAARSINRATHG
jgi:hypothetical protein